MTEHARHEPMRHVDAAWLRMDSAENPMVITSALFFDGPVPFEDLLRVIEERQLAEIRFRQRVVDSNVPLVHPRWELDERFDIRAHVHHLRVPAPADGAAFDRLIGDLMSGRLDPARPLWQTYIIDDAPGGTALVSRIHHCLADGVSLVQFLLSLCDTEQAVRPAEVGLNRPNRRLLPAEAAKRAAELTATTARLLLLPPDSPTALRGDLGTQKGVARSRAVPLEPLKRAAKRLGGTLNDLLAAAVTGAIRTYLLERGTLPASGEVRAMVPVFLRDQTGGHLGNHFGLVFLGLPVGETTPERQFHEVKARMDLIKGQDDATVAFGVLDAVGIASAEIERIALDIFTRKASLVMTNVPGPAESVHLGGHRIRELCVWAPVSGSIGVGVTLMSYAGSVTFGVVADAKLVPNPGAIAAAFEDELARFI